MVRQTWFRGTIVIDAGTTAMGSCSGGERLAQLQIQQQKVGI